MKKSFGVGLLLIVVVAVIWALASLVVADAEDDGVDPFFITFVCNSLFVLYLVPVFFFKRRRRLRTTDDDDEKDEKVASAKYLSPLWMVANGLYNVSLSLTSITSSTILSTTSSLWALFFAVRWNVEAKGNLAMRTFGAFLCVAGSACAAFADDDDDDDDEEGQGKKESFLGDVIALVSAALYGAYGAGLRLSDDSERAPMKFFGMLGLWNFVYFAAPMAVYLGVRSPSKSLAKQTGFLGAPPGRDFGLVIAKGLFDNALSDFLWAQAVVRTTPTVATVGLSLTIPLAFLTDAFVTKDLPTTQRSLALQVVGALLVLAGFVVTVLSSAEEEKSANDDLKDVQRGATGGTTTTFADDDDVIDDDEEAKDCAAAAAAAVEGGLGGLEESDDDDDTAAPPSSLGSAYSVRFGKMLLVSQKKTTNPAQNPLLSSP